MLSICISLTVSKSDMNFSKLSLLTSVVLISSSGIVMSIGLLTFLPVTAKIGVISVFCDGLHLRAKVTAVMYSHHLDGCDSVSFLKAACIGACILSICPLQHGCRLLVFLCCMLYILNKFFNTTDKKFIPKSLTMIWG